MKGCCSWNRKLRLDKNGKVSEGEVGEFFVSILNK